MTPFRDNPSDAEKERKLTTKEKRKYRTVMLIGLFGLVTVALTLLGFIFDWIPKRWNLQMWAFSYMLIGLMVYSVLLVAGFSKGRDRRPGVIEMLAAAGRGH